MKRTLIPAAIIILAVRLIWMYLIPAWNEIFTDFPNYYTAAWTVRHDRPLADLYDPAWFQQETERAGIRHQVALFNYFTPFSALVMWPVANLPPLQAKRVWVVVNVALFAAVILLVARHLKAPSPVVLLVALLGGDALGNNFTFGQFYIVLTLLIVIGVVLHERRPLLAGICLSVAAVVKIFPAIFVAVWRWKAVAATLLGVIVLSAIGLSVIGWVPHRVYLEEVFARTLRGEIQDPYSVQWNTLQALLRRALVLEPGLNPNPIFNAPALFFFVRPFVTIVLIGITLLSVRDRRFTLIEYGAIIAAISLVTPSQASYHQFLFFPAVAAAIHRTADVKVQLTWAVAFALICSNYMGAFTRFDAGPLMMLAFPRVFIIFAMWMAFLGERLRPRFLLPIAAIVALAGTITEYRRWAEDERDNARMVHPERRGLMETHPIVGPRGLVYTSLGRAGYTRPPDPALAIRELDGGYLLVENNQELFRREKVIRDPAISPDGAFISVAEWVDNRYRIQEWDRRDGTIRTLLSGPADYRYPAYDPSGQWLAFATNESGNWDLARISRRDGHKEFLTTSKANDLMPAFSLDGKTLYFASDRRRGYRFTAIYAIALSR